MKTNPPKHFLSSDNEFLESFVFFDNVQTYFIYKYIL